MATDSVLAETLPQRTGVAALANLPIGQILMLLAGIAALAGIVVASVNWARTPDYKVLFANLSDRDGGSVVAALSQMNVPYRFAEGGGAILVPGGQVHDARLKLASQGLPKGGTVGFELMETQRFGVTQFQERLNFQRGLEGELTRSIQSLAAVQGARIHLALPAQNGFLREQQKPSASVLVQLHPGRTLDRAQVAGIIHLVASSVPDLSPKSVSVVDQSGSLLSNSGEGQAAGLDPSQLNYVRQVESGFSQRITDILEPILGRGNIRAQVTADVDFTQSESTAELFKPNQGAEPAAVRSMQSTESTDRAGGAAQGVPGAASNQPLGATPAGVPGAVTNQPPPGVTAPINGPAQALAAAAAAGGAGGSNRRESVTNFEVDKTVRVTRNGSGAIRRLSAAVVVNHRKAGADGKTVPLEAAEIENINALVREAIGFSKDRGDSINVVNASFSREELPEKVELPLWKQPETIDMAKDGARYLGLLILALIVIFTVVKPALKSITARQAPAQGRLNQTVENDLSLPSPAAAAAEATAMQNIARNEDILKLARENPAAVANVVRNWVTKDGT